MSRRVVHFDHAGPLHAEDGRVIVDGPWGIYFRLGGPDGIVGGGLPERLPRDVPLEPYGEDNAAHVAGAGFVDLFTAGLARALKRFRGAGDRWEARARRRGHRADGRRLSGARPRRAATPT